MIFTSKSLIFPVDASTTSQTELGHLQWMLKKDLLGQDMFLIGPPGPMRRRLAMAFAELTCREVEYISLSRDTTESDMKQRREVIHKTATYIDQVSEPLKVTCCRP